MKITDLIGKVLTNGVEKEIVSAILIVNHVLPPLDETASFENFINIKKPVKRYSADELSHLLKCEKR